jgi:hypothetical protein
VHPIFFTLWSPMHVNELTTAEYSSHYTTYIQLVSSEYNLVEELEISLHRFIKFVQNIPLDKFDYRYADGKWTIKEIIQHLMDAERIFAYRALRFARNDKTELPGYDENAFAFHINPRANTRKLPEMLSEFTLIRQSSIALFQTFTADELKRGGIASQATSSVRAIGFIIIGHQNHHQHIFEARYL